jgi:hypothetical protein
LAEASPLSLGWVKAGHMRATLEDRTGCDGCDNLANTATDNMSNIVMASTQRIRVASATRKSSNHQI